MEERSMHDVAIVGGGAAGLSAAVALGRSMRSVVVIDGGEPRNGVSAHAHNVLAREGASPHELLAAGRAEAESYGALIRRGHVVAARREDGGFVLDLAEGEPITARRLLLATGLSDELPDIPGVRQHWGTSVLHCAYCHGWEVRGRRIGVLGTSPMTVHQALLFRQLSDDVTVFRHRIPHLGDDETAQLRARDIRIVDGVVERLASEGDTLTGAVLDDGREHAIDALVVGPRFMARADLYEQLGGTLTEHPMGEFIPTEPTGRTEVHGVWAAGNVSNLMAMVVVAMGEGVMVGAQLNADLVTEETEAAVRARVAA